MKIVRAVLLGLVLPYAIIFAAGYAAFWMWPDSGTAVEVAVTPAALAAAFAFERRAHRRKARQH